MSTAATDRWKTAERRFAKLLGGQRLWRPDFGEELPDGFNETDVWDVKYRASHRAVELYVEAEKKYREYTGPRRFILGLFSAKHGRHGDFVLSRGEDYARLVRMEKLLAEVHTIYGEAHSEVWERVRTELRG